MDNDTVPDSLYGPQRDIYLRALEGDPEGMFILASMYHDGAGLEQSDSKAFEWCLKAAEKGHVNAQNNVATMYVCGNGVKKSATEAFRWFKAAAENGLADAQFNLYLMYYNGIGVDNSMEEAGKWLVRAAEQNHPVAMEHIGKFYKR
ncbi:MAG: sel1 repeat family protein [archaeon]|nr:sel1 repeat family protein [archaeon]